MDTVMETCDLDRSSRHQLERAAELLQGFARMKAAKLGEGIRLCFNSRLDDVYLIDDKDRIALLDSHGRVRRWYRCPNCGIEGFDGGCGLVDGSWRKLQFVRYRKHCSERCQSESGVRS